MSTLTAETRGAILRRMRREGSDDGKLARYRAEQLLELAGRGARATTISRWAKRRFSRMPKATRQALVAFTLEYRDGGGRVDPAVRQLDPDTIPPRRAANKEAAMPRRNLTETEQTRVRQACIDALVANPDAQAADVRANLKAEGIDVDGRLMNGRYWLPAKRELGLIGDGSTPAKPADSTPSAKAAVAPSTNGKASAPSKNGKGRKKAEATPVDRRPQLPPPAPVFPEGLHLVPRLDGTAEIRIDRVLPLPVALRVLAAAAEEMGKEVAA